MRRAARPLLYLGVVAVVLGLARIHARYVGHYDWSGSARAVWTMAYIGLLAVTAYGLGLPDVPRSMRAAIGPAVGAASAGALAVSGVQLVAGDALLPRFVVFGSATLLSGWYIACTALAQGGRDRSEERDRILVVASVDEAEALRGDLDRVPERPAVVVADLRPFDAASHRPKARPLLERAIAERASVIVLDRAAQAEPSIVSQAAALHESGFRIRTLSQFYEEWLAKLPVSELERVSLFFDIGEVHRVQYGRIKRIADLVAAALGSVALILIVPFLAVANRVGNQGPLFYRQPRVGKNGRIFNIVKFRTMRPSSDGSASWTTSDDPRVTAFGRVLRRTHIDELPQMINILKGDLSLVGPRPEQPRYVEELMSKLPFYNLRHSVRPGLTGWAQVKYGYGGDERDALEKLQYEFWYLRHQSLSLDIRVLGRTVRSVTGRGSTGR